MTAYAICSDMDVASVTSESMAIPGAVSTTPGGVVPEHWGVATNWEGPRGAIDVGEAVGKGLAVSSRVGGGNDGRARGVGCPPPRGWNRDRDMGCAICKSRTKGDNSV